MALRRLAQTNAIGAEYGDELVRRLDQEMRPVHRWAAIDVVLLTIEAATRPRNEVYC